MQPGAARKRGVSIIEAALVLPLFLLLLMGMFEFGIVISAYQSMVGAAREGARIAVTPDPAHAYVLPGAGNVAQAVCRKLEAGVFGPLATCSNYPANSPNASATCPPFSGGKAPKLSTEDVYYNLCTVAVPEGGTETYVQVGVGRTVQLFWGIPLQLSTRAFMRSEAN
jgi:hypothetical protein